MCSPEPTSEKEHVRNAWCHTVPHILVVLWICNTARAAVPTIARRSSAGVGHQSNMITTRSRSTPIVRACCWPDNKPRLAVSISFVASNQLHPDVRLWTRLEFATQSQHVTRVQKGECNGGRIYASKIEPRVASIMDCERRAIHFP